MRITMYKLMSPHTTGTKTLELWAGPFIFPFWGNTKVLTMDKEAYKLILNYFQVTRKNHFKWEIFKLSRFLFWSNSSLEKKE